jgi:hypothetical protein
MTDDQLEDMLFFLAQILSHGVQGNKVLSLDIVQRQNIKQLLMLQQK